MILTSLLSLLTLVVTCYSISENEVLIPDERLKPQIGPPRIDIPYISDHLIFEKEHENKPLMDDFATRAIDRKVDGLVTNKEDGLVVAPHLVNKQTTPETLRQELKAVDPNNDSLKSKGMYCIKYSVILIYRSISFYRTSRLYNTSFI